MQWPITTGRLAYGRLGYHGKAIEDYDRALELNPGYEAAQRNRAIAYGNLGKTANRPNN